MPVTFVEGGERRQDSVRAGFEALGADRAGPDGRAGGARPRRRAARCVPAALVAAVVEATVRHGAAIPVVPVVETLKRVDGDRVAATVDRVRAGRGPDARRASGAGSCATALGLGGGRRRDLDR